VFAVLLFTLSLHYMILPMPDGMHHLLHETDLHRRLCYIPIILGALWFGLRGGLLTAALISIAVLPLAWRFQGPLSSNQDFVEICFYFSIGILAGILVDMKDRERAKKEQLEHELASAERMAALGRASAGIAHEVRTPLGSIQGAAEILSDDFPADHEHRPFFDILMQECRRLGRVVDDFLDLSRPISLDRGEMAVDTLLESALSVVRSLSAEKRISLAITAPSDAGSALVDPHRIHQALVNMLRNAVQVTGPEGSVDLCFRWEGSTAVFEVLDRGPGLDPGDGERIFEPFFTRKKDGTGLGLPLARQVATAHGGKLVASPRSGGGTVFTLRIPAREEGDL
jgi:signal transduction histidine kinase